MSLEMCTHTVERVRLQIFSGNTTEAREGFHCHACNVVYLGQLLVPCLTPLGRMFAGLMDGIDEKELLR